MHYANDFNTVTNLYAYVVEVVNLINEKTIYNINKRKVINYICLLCDYVIAQVTHHYGFITTPGNYNDSSSNL